VISPPLLELQQVLLVSGVFAFQYVISGSQLSFTFEKSQKGGGCGFKLSRVLRHQNKPLSFLTFTSQPILPTHTQLVLPINTRVILPHLADSYAQTKLSQSASHLHFSTSKFSSISLGALQTTTEEVFWSERSTAAKLMAPDEVDTIRLWTVVKPFRSLCMWDEALARRLFHPSTAYQTLQTVSEFVFTIDFALLQMARWVFNIRKFSLGSLPIIF
jgi:hypothetical protein